MAGRWRGSWGELGKTALTCAKAASQPGSTGPALFPAPGSGALGSGPIPARLQTSPGLLVSHLSQTFMPEAPSLDQEKDST